MELLASKYASGIGPSVPPEHCHLALDVPDPGRRRISFVGIEFAMHPLPQNAPKRAAAVLFEDDYEWEETPSVPPQMHVPNSNRELEWDLAMAKSALAKIRKRKTTAAETIRRAEQDIARRERALAYFTQHSTSLRARLARDAVAAGKKKLTASMCSAPFASLVERTYHEFGLGPFKSGGCCTV